MATENWMQTPRPRILGKNLLDHQGEMVTILGYGHRQHPTGYSFVLKPVDGGEDIPVQMNTPLPDHAIVDGCVVEVQGKVSGNSITCFGHVTFPSEMTAKFTPDAYNNAVKFMHAVKANT